jgi:hypothetical protein
MSVHNRQSVLMFNDHALQSGIETFTTQLPNPDGTSSSALDDLLRYQREARKPGGPNERPHSIKYTLLGILVAFYLLMASNRTVSEANACRLLLHELTPQQRGRLGMSEDLTGTRYDLIEPGLRADATDQQIQVSTRELEKENARLAKAYSEVIKHIDPSPFRKGTKMTNALRNAIRADQFHPDRRIDPQTAQRNQERMIQVINKIIAPSAAAASVDGWSGDIATDETIHIVLPLRYGHGFEDDKKAAVDPDAEWWNGKDGDGPEDIGHGYGITYVIRVPRPYGPQIPVVAIGMHVGPPTGGQTAPFAEALHYAERFGLTKANQQRVCVADKGYTKLDDWTPTLLEAGYNVVADYNQAWSRTKVLKDTTINGKPANGPVLSRGPILCPGASGLGPQDLPTPKLAQSSDPADIVELRRRMRLVEALRMKVRNPLRRSKAAGRGRPKAGATPPATFTVTLQCPAHAGLCNCSNYRPADGSRNPNLPDVPNPPHPDPAEAHLRPRSCMQDFTNYTLDATEVKWVQSEFWGSHLHNDVFTSMRGDNERNHSGLKSNDGVGVQGSGWVEVRGIAKLSLLFSIATAVNTRNLTRRFITEGAATRETEAEFNRRRRERLADQMRKQGVA